MPTTEHPEMLDVQDATVEALRREITSLKAENRKLKRQLKKQEKSNANNVDAGAGTVTKKQLAVVSKIGG